MQNMATAVTGGKSSILGLLGRSENVLEQIDLYADKHFLHIVDRKKGLLLEKLVRRRKPKLALETGTLVGYSAIRIARNLPRNGRLLSVEISKRGLKKLRGTLRLQDLETKWRSLLAMPLRL